MSGLWRSRQSHVVKAIEQIVSAYVKLGNAGALEAMKALRQGLAARARQGSGSDFGAHLTRIEEEIAAIEPGLAKLSGTSEDTCSFESDPTIDLRPPGMG
jgi:hypothetical protein